MSKQRRLGRGLDALLAPGRRDGKAQPGDPAAVLPVTEIAIDALRPGRYQPRRQVQEQGLRELADSIREQGVLQPLVVRPAQATTDDKSEFEVVAGERRWRAARMAGLQSVPVVIRELDDQSALAVALIENLQREDLSPIDQAHSLARLAGEFSLTHEQVAKAVGRSRASVSNLLRLLDLHDDVKDLLAAGRIDMGHARALLSLDGKRQVSMARKVEASGMSVRQVEESVRDLQSPRPAGTGDRPTIDLQTRWLQQQIAGELGQKISIRQATNGEYSLRIGFRDLTRLHEALQRMEELVGRIRNTAGPRAREARDDL
ncbi:MAG TPA: ParB/RepB/Spo0J family partition protein [Woeseiaceae bacterium]